MSDPSGLPSTDPSAGAGGRSLWAAAARRIGEAEVWLLEAQDGDGLWREFDLEIGAAAEWTTAVVGWALALPPRRAGTADGRRRARRALLERMRPAGWGYNRRASPDADSTSWALRFLALESDGERPAPNPLAALELLSPFLGPDGRARTFPSAERFGTWGQPHDDVTPVVGLALAECGVEGAIARRVRAAVLAACAPPRGWRAFWWRSPEYANARALELLAATGGVPPGVRQALEPPAPPDDPFSAAQVLARTAAEGLPSGVAIATLVTTARPEGGWNGSRALLVPDQGDGAPGEPREEPAGILTTALAVAALKAASSAGG